MESHGYKSMKNRLDVNRRDFLKIGGALGIGLLLGNPAAWAQEKKSPVRPPRPGTSVEEAMKIPKTRHSLPGPFPGRVVEVHNPAAMMNDKPVDGAVSEMFKSGLERLTQKSLKKSFGMFFDKGDVVGIKVNPVGAGLISTRHEVVSATIDWLTANGLKRENIVIWDRFDFMLKEAGFVPERYPGIDIVGLQTMSEDVDEKGTPNEKSDATWLDKNGNHISAGNFDLNVYYWADVEGPKDRAYLNQHVFNGKYSYFGKLLTQRLTKIINIPVFKNTGNGISMATKNLGYGAICNTNRLHNPLFFDVCTEVLAFPVIRDKLVLNVTDGLRGQYNGGPEPAAEFVYPLSTLFFATDPFALDTICQRLMVEKRKSMQVKVNEHPMFTEYLRYGQRLGLGIADPDKIEHVRI